LKLSVRARPAGPVKSEHIVDVWPGKSGGTPLVLVVPADSVFDPRLLRLLISQENPAALVDSGIRRPQLQTLIASAPDTARGKLCGPAVLSYEWASGQDGLFEDAMRHSLDRNTLAAVDVSHQPLYYVSLRRKLRPYWFPVPAAANRKLATRVLFDSIQKGTLDIPALLHASIETFLISLLCKTRITPNQL